MNVTQIIQSAASMKNKGEKTEISEELFSKAFETFTGKPSSKEKTPEQTDAESEETGTVLSESEKEENVSFILINPFLKLDLDNETTDTKLAGQAFILHKETQTNETNLLTVNLSDLSKEQLSVLTDKGIHVNGEPTVTLSGQQMNVLADTVESVQLQDGKTVSPEISEALMSTISEESIAASETKLSVDKGEVSQVKAMDIPETEKAQKTEPTSIEKAREYNEETEVKQPSEKSVTAYSKLLSGKSVSSDSVENNKNADRQTDPSQQITKAAENNQKPEAKGPTVKNVGKEIKQTVDLNSQKMTETADIDIKGAEKLIKNSPEQKQSSQLDTDHDFVSMLRQLSSQSTEKTSQKNNLTMAKAPDPVSKEQSVNLIQDMVTNLVENKEGQKTYQTTLHLTPKTLGEITVELSLTEEGLSGKLTFQSDEARRWMEGEWLDLKSPLESKGISIKSFDFTATQPGPQQNSFSFSDQSGQESKNQPGSSNEQVQSAESEEQSAEPSAGMSDSLNVYV